MNERFEEEFKRYFGTNDCNLMPSFLDCARHFYELGKNAKENTLTIKGWVARDDDRTLTFFFSKPHRACYVNDEIYFENELEDGMIPWVWSALKNSNQEYILLPTTMFPDLKWEDEPIEVELTIDEIKHGEDN